MLPRSGSPSRVQESLPFMEARRLRKYRQQLHSQMPLIGGWLKDQALKTLVEDGSAEAVRAVADVVVQGDEEPLQQTALAALESLAAGGNVAAQESLCRLVVHHAHARARKIVLAAHYHPHEEAQRALFYFLTGQWDAYDKLDFDRHLLRAIYDAADEKLRNCIARQARRAGRLEWVDLVAGGRQGKRLAGMTDAEWTAALAVLTSGERTEDLWRLAQEAPPRWSAAILKAMKKPRTLVSEPERPAVDELAKLAKQWEDADFSPLLYHRMTLQGHQHQIRCLAFTASGKILASGSADHTVRLWRLADGELLRTLDAHVGWVNGLAPTPNGRMLVSVGRDGRLCLWRLPGGKPTAVIEGHAEAILAVKVTSDGKLLITASVDGLIRLWRLPDGHLLKTLGGHKGAISTLALSADDQLLASGGTDNTIRLWTLPDGRAGKTLEAPWNENGEGVVSLAISPDGKILASSARDGTIQLWGLPSGRSLKSLRLHTGYAGALVISPDSSLLASAGGEYAVQLWRLPGGRLLRTLEGHVQDDPRLILSQDGQLLASSSQGGWGPDHMIRVWSLQGRRWPPPRLLSGHRRTVTSLALSPDRMLLASGDDEGTIRVWGAELERLSRLPVGKARLKDLEWVQAALQSDTISETEQKTLAFIAALMRWRRRLDIFVGEPAARVIEVGEFDIEIEG
jgi:WD40 repeat protein